MQAVYNNAEEQLCFSNVRHIKVILRQSGEISSFVVFIVLR